MNKHIALTIILLLAVCGVCKAQRAMDVLDRGLVAVKTSDGVFCSWRITGEEWYDVNYNIYRDGTKLNSSPLSVSNYHDAAGTQNSNYTVTAIVNGTEQPACAAVKPFDNEAQYLSIPMAPVYIPMVATNGETQHDVTAFFEPNDATCSDVDGDGQYEIILKRENNDMTAANDSLSTRFEVYKLNGTKLWQIDVGKNMQSLSNVETNIIAADFDQDGKIECALRVGDGAQLNDGTIIGSTQNFRNDYNTSQTFQCEGGEYLLLLDGETGALLDCIDFPLERGKVNDWGDGYGHRANKFFFGAPYLDGRHPSLFLGRGIYTKIMMCALDIVDKKFVERWSNKTDFVTAGSEWYGQGYHNYIVADVDNDGRDEIVYGSMVVDDNGKGLYTTGLGHGDAQHCGDFDPYHKGLEFFGCLEDNAGANYRAAGTGKILWRYKQDRDCGRCMAANITNDFDGFALLADGSVQSASDKTRDPNAPSYPWRQGATATVNFQLYWDGSLLHQTFDYASFTTDPRVGVSPTIYNYEHPEKNFVMKGCVTNNDTKGNPCLTADIFGDWREEVIVRTRNNNEIRIYTTTEPCEYRIYTLMHDMQYYNAIQWQMCGYNQPPHQSFFLGVREGITTPPPPVMTNGRTEIKGNGSISQSQNGEHVLLCEMDGAQVSIADGAKPCIVTVNSPKDYTLTGTSLSGENTRLVKQGAGQLIINTSGDMTYGGNTDLWDGVTSINGTVTNSDIWVNRFAELNMAGTAKTIAMEYGSILRIGNTDALASLKAASLTTKRGSELHLDIHADGSEGDNADLIDAENIALADGTIINLNVTVGADGAPVPGRYLIAKAQTLTASLENITLKGVDGLGASLIAEDGNLYIDLPEMRAATSVVWLGTQSGVWDVNNSLNFGINGDNGVFVNNDDVVFNDDAVTTDINIVTTVSPKSITFDNSVKEYVLDGEGAIVGETAITKNGDGMLSINNLNRYTGGTYVNGGVLAIGRYANRVGSEYGALGNVANRITLSNNAILSLTATGTLGNKISISQNHGTIDVAPGASVTLESGITQSTPGQKLTKTGSGTLTLGQNNSLGRLIIDGGAVNAVENSDSRMQLPDVVEFIKGSLYDVSDIYSYSKNTTKYVVETGNSGSLYLDARCDYTGTLTGGGQLTVYAASVRNYLKGDWSAFTGKLIAAVHGRGSSYDPVFYWSNNYGLPNATLQVNSGTDFNAESHSVQLGNLTGNGTVTTTGTVTVGSLNEPMTFNGTFAGQPTLVKVGTGDWKVSKAITGPKSINVKDGTISLAASNINTNVCQMPIVLSGSALMRGRGTVKKLTVSEGAILEPGYYSESTPVHYGPINVQDELAVQSGAVLSLYIRKADGTTNSRSYVTVGSTFTLNGAVRVTIDSDYAPNVGDKIVLWDAKAFAGSPSEIILPELPDGMKWDTSSLTSSKGVLKVAASDGIMDIAADAAVRCEVYTAEGRLVGTIDTTVAKATADIRRKLRCAAGIYVLRMMSSDKVISIKVNL